MTDIVDSAKERFERAKSAWGEVYDAARDDLRFQSDDVYAQWDEREYNERIDTGRPVITVDQCSQFIHQVENDIRQNTPSINIIPAGDGADVETAEILKGFIRNIEYRSAADAAYDTASSFSVRCSIGFIRVDHDYVNDRDFRQELCIKRVVNPFACYIDPMSIEPDGRDAMFGFVIEPIKVREFKKRWPKFDAVCFTDVRDTIKEDDEINYAEYFEIVENEFELVQTEDGAIGTKPPEGLRVVNSRVIKKRKVVRRLMSGQDVLEETTFPGKYIPIVPVYGEEAWQDGKRKLLSLIRKAKGSQRMLNLWKSLETEMLLKQPNAPVMVPEGAIEDYAQDWIKPNKSMALRYKQFAENGQPYNPPQRLEPPTIPTGFVNASREAVDDIKATMGLYNASIGQRSNETSGKAINARKLEGDVATYHFGDNLVRSITQVGRILVCAIAEIHDVPQVIRTINKEDKPENVGINGERVEGQERDYNLTNAEYDVRVTTGASYTTARQEAAEFYTQVISRQPELMEIAGDLLFKNMDFAGAPELAARMEKIVAPKFQEGAPDPEKQQMQMLIQQGQQVLQQQAQEIESLKAQLQNKAMETQIKARDTQIKAQTEAQKNQIELEKAKMDYAIKMEELAIKKVDLAIKERELGVREYEAANQPTEIAAGDAAGNSAAA